ncbi:MAG: aspartate--tRNA ligase [Opitutaceae bacterium]
MKSTHHCAQLRSSDIGSQATLTGWVDTVRDHGGIIFMDLRDREGVTQIMVDPHVNSALADQVAHLKTESVVAVRGQVIARPADTLNPNLDTGDVEVEATALEIFNLSDTPPFPIDDEAGDRVNEETRLAYRYLDLRRPKMRRMLRLRHKANRTIRDYFDDNDFTEVETPLLFKSTPEGAREFLVPSRTNPGQFYALVQSPQQFKQILMVAGVERYYQIARCFRDEDLRADRQPEFTQLDIEVSFIDREGMYALMEGLCQKIWKDVLGVEIPKTFPRMTFADAMNRFGVDKPDTRFGMELEDFTETFRHSGFKVFESTIAAGGVVKAMKGEGLADVTQGELNSLTEAAKAMGAKGLAFIKVEGGEWKSPIVKFFTDEEKAELTRRLEIGEGDIIFFAAAPWEKACGILGRIRLECAEFLKKRGKLEIPADRYDFLWVVDFPLMSFDDDQNRFVATHHPFTSPVPEDIAKLDSDPKAVRGQHYDLVLNGVELGGGSIRIHQPDLQKKVFEDVLKIPPALVEERFGYMLRAFRYGAPPHGGIALGLDRLVSILSGVTSIRDVIAFPKTQKGQCLMSQSPTPVTDRQLRDLHIATLSEKTTENKP